MHFRGGGSVNASVQHVSVGVGLTPCLIRQRKTLHQSVDEVN